MSKRDTPAILYARFSGRPNEANCVSDEMQLDRMRRYCRDRGYPIAGEFCETVLVEKRGRRAKKGISGTSLKDRPQLRAALEQAKNLRGVLVCTKIDRFARSMRDTQNILEELRLRGAGFVAAEQNIDTRSRDPMSKAFVSFLALFAELEADFIRCRTQESMLDHLAAGRRMGRVDRLPYGQRCDEKGPRLVRTDKQGLTVTDLPARMVKDHGEQQVLAFMRRLRRAGVGARRMTRILNQDPHLGLSEHQAARDAYKRAVELGTRKLSRNGAKWHLSTVRKLLDRLDGSPDAQLEPQR
jgi:DNA invertase Pin-like site-specific DNA recombinase